MAQRVTPEKSGINYWLLIADPDEYSYADLERDTATVWDGSPSTPPSRTCGTWSSDEEVLFFHGGTELAIVGIARITSDTYPDPQGTSADEVAAGHRPRAAPGEPDPLAEIENLPEFQDSRPGQQPGPRRSCR